MGGQFRNSARVIWVWRRIPGAEAEAEAEAGAEAEAEADRSLGFRGMIFKPSVAPGGHSVLPSIRVLYFFSPLRCLRQSPPAIPPFLLSPSPARPPRPRGPPPPLLRSIPISIKDNFHSIQMVFPSLSIHIISSTQLHCTYVIHIQFQLRKFEPNSMQLRTYVRTLVST